MSRRSSVTQRFSILHIERETIYSDEYKLTRSRNYTIETLFGSWNFGQGWWRTFRNHPKYWRYAVSYERPYYLLSYEDNEGMAEQYKREVQGKR